MTKAAEQQAELPMKDVTPKKGDKVETAPITEDAPRSKGGRNRGPSQVKERPKAPAPMNRAAASNAVVAHQPQQPKSMLAIIAEAASNPAVNPDNMRALLDMQKEIAAEERRQAFDAAFIALQADLPVIDKDGKIEIRKKDERGERAGALQQATPYATFEAIMDAIQPLLTKHGFGLSFETKSLNDRLLVIGHLIGHGHERSTEFPLPAETSGSKNNVQGWGSSMSYGKRYCTIALLNIRSRAPQDRDADGHYGRFVNAKGGGLAQEAPPVETISETQQMNLIEAIEGCGVPMAKFLDHYGIKKVADLPADLYGAAVKACQDYAHNQARKGAR